MELFKYNEYLIKYSKFHSILTPTRNLLNGLTSDIYIQPVGGIDESVSWSGNHKKCANRIKDDEHLHKRLYEDIGMLLEESRSESNCNEIGEASQG